MINKQIVTLIILQMDWNYFRALTGILHCLSRCWLLYHHYCRFRWSVHWCTYNKLAIRLHRAGLVFISVARWHSEVQNICKVSFSFAQVDAFVLAGTPKLSDAKTNAQHKWQDGFWIERCAMPDIGCQQQQIDVYCFAMRIIERCHFFFCLAAAQTFSLALVWVCITQFNYILLFCLI